MSTYSSKFIEDLHADGVAGDAIDYVMECFSSKLDDIALSALEVPFTTQLAMMKINKIVQLAIVQPDGDYFVEGILERLDPDGEPCPSTIDSWARGAVSTKKVLIEDNSFRSGVPGAPSSAPSVSSFRSSATGRSKGTTGSRGTKHSGSNMDKTGQIIELDDDPDAEFGNFNSTAPQFDMLQRQKKAKIKGFVEKEDVKGEFELMQESIDKANKEMGGKKFILDRYGKPVAIGKVNVESLPAFATPMGTYVQPTPPPVSDDVPPPEEANGKEANGKDNNKDSKKKKQYIRVAGSRGVEESTFKPTTSLATTLSGIEHMGKVGAGVTVRSLGNVKAGERIQDDPHKMSRSQYFSQTQSRHSQSRLDTNSQFSKSMESGSFHDVRVGERGMHHSDSANRYATGQHASTSSVRSMELLPDLDEFDGSRRLFSDNVQHDMSDEELGMGPKVSEGRVKKGVLPKKPSDAQKANIDLITGSPENGKPRDRDLPKNMRPVADRKHLPAPPIGQITGHGLSLEKYLEKSAIVASVDATGDDWHQQWRNA